MRRRRLRRIAVVLLAGLAGTAVCAGDVDTDLTLADRIYVQRMLRSVGRADLHENIAASLSNDGKIDAILAAQDAVLRHGPIHVGIPLDHEREPRDLFEAGHGLCFDRSRAIEKSLAFLGFETRHLAVYSVDEGVGTWEHLFGSHRASHSVTEVRVDDRWIVVDSNARWIGLTAGGRALSVEELRGSPDLASSAWDRRVSDPPSFIFAMRFTYVIGLYSRHGRFYPPFVPVPDVDVAQLWHNFAPS
jgi:hypothetical protein